MAAIRPRPGPAAPAAEPAVVPAPAEAGRAAWLGVGSEGGEPPAPAGGSAPAGEETRGQGPVAVLPDARSLPALVGQVVEAVFPDGVPLVGVLPVDVAGIEAAAGGLVAGLPLLGVEVADGWASPGRWAWAAAAALAAGGAYTARAHRGRAGHGPLGTDSALARWEERRAGRPV